jgi:hypothetical protein
MIYCTVQSRYILAMHLVLTNVFKFKVSNIFRPVKHCTSYLLRNVTGIALRELSVSSWWLLVYRLLSVQTGQRWKS